tara:strand:+ start:476 stop:1222 length:747 start_codon:yes stop_codon:yes gene_type:complete
MSYSDLEYELFSRQFILKEFSEEKISKLNDLYITVVGVGGIGCPLSQYLISSGIKNLTIVDGDIVEKNNLNRQILFSIDDLGKKKVNVAKDKLIKTNPKSNIKIIDNNINKKNIGLLNKPSIIIDTTDNWQISKILNEYCVKNSISFLFSSAVGFDIQIALFSNKKSKHSCLNCIFPNKEDVDLPRCETIGISGITAGMAGLITAQKILNYLLNLKIEKDTITLYNVKNEELHKIQVKNNNQCYLNNS